MDRETYLFHQTPKELAKELLTHLSLAPTDILCEPFKGEGAFYDSFPEGNPKVWAEKEQGVDYKDISGNYDWVITNPPFRLEGEQGRFNSFWYLLDYFTRRAHKGIAFLGNDSCFSTLTPKRITLLKQRGWGIQKVVVCSVKKWRGRYFFIVFRKGAPGFMDCVLGNY